MQSLLHLEYLVKLLELVIEMRVLNTNSSLKINKEDNCDMLQCTQWQPLLELLDNCDQLQCTRWLSKLTIISMQVQCYFEHI